MQVCTVLRKRPKKCLDYKCQASFSMPKVMIQEAAVSERFLIFEKISSKNQQSVPCCRCRAILAEVRISVCNSHKASIQHISRSSDHPCVERQAGAEVMNAHICDSGETTIFFLRFQERCPEKTRHCVQQKGHARIARNRVAAV